ncbi:MAG: pentapeptide repeat-containing protein [Chloroflexota bacterium]
MTWKIFLSHASRDKALADKLIEEIKHELGFQDHEIFNSSSVETIPKGNWRDAIEQALLEAQVVIPLITPCGEKNMWVAFECGYFWGNRLPLGKDAADKKPYLIYTLYTPKSKIPSALDNDMAKCVTDRNALEVYFKTLCGHFGIEYKGVADRDSIVATALKTPLVTAEDFRQQMEAKVWLKQAKDTGEQQIIIDWLHELDILRGIRLDWTGNLQNLKFPRANLYKANLGGNDLRGASFFDAILEDAHLGTTCLQRADFTGAILTGASFAAAETDEHTKLPDGNPYPNVEERWERLLQAGVKSTDKIAPGIIRCK